MSTPSDIYVQRNYNTAEQDSNFAQLQIDSPEYQKALALAREAAYLWYGNLFIPDSHMLLFNDVGVPATKLETSASVPAATNAPPWSQTNLPDNLAACCNVESPYFPWEFMRVRVASIDKTASTT